jgi:endonuclease YncB( thermonuclease family)
MAPSSNRPIGRSSRIAVSAVLIFKGILGLATPCLSETFTAKAVSVSDGDTFTVLHDGKEEVIRLNGIDCPEKNQTFGKKAKKFTSDRVLDETVSVEAVDIDRDGRTIGEVVLADGTNLSRALVQEGLAWWFFKHSQDETLHAMEMEARGEKRGLWHDPIPIPPWVFRKIQRKQVPELSDFQYPDTVASSSAVLGSKGSKIYRHPGCKKFHAMLTQKNVIPLDTIESAKEAGYHAASDCPKTQ